MNCMKEAESKLRDYAARKNSLQSLSTEIQLVQTRRQTAPDDAHGVFSGSGYVDTLAEENELRTAYRAVNEWVRNVERGLRVLTMEEYLILDRFYIHRKKGHAEQLMEELHLEKAQVYRRKDEALRHFTLALYGVTET